MIDLFLQTLSIGGWHVNNKWKYLTYSNEEKKNCQHYPFIVLVKLSNLKQIINHCNLLNFAETFRLI